MKNAIKTTYALSVVFLMLFNACGKTSKPSNNEPSVQDTAKIDSNSTGLNGGQLVAKVKHMVQYTKIKNPEFDYCDSSRVQIDLVEASGGDKLICDKINQKLITEITSKEYPTIDALLHANDKLEAATYKVIKMTILFIDNNILSVKIDEDNQECGFDTESFSTVLNFDISTGEIIEFSSCISNQNIKSFEKIAGDEFIKKYDSKEYDIKKPSDFKVNDGFSFSNKGITFYFEKYEIGYGALGESEIFVPYSKFKNLIEPNSIISKY